MPKGDISSRETVYMKLSLIAVTMLGGAILAICLNVWSESRRFVPLEYAGPEPFTEDGTEGGHPHPGGDDNGGGGTRTSPTTQKTTTTTTPTTTTPTTTTPTTTEFPPWRPGVYGGYDSIFRARCGCYPYYCLTGPWLHLSRCDIRNNNQLWTTKWGTMNHFMSIKMMYYSQYSMSVSLQHSALDNDGFRFSVGSIIRQTVFNKCLRCQYIVSIGDCWSSTPFQYSSGDLYEGKWRRLYGRGHMRPMRARDLIDPKVFNTKSQ